MLKEQKDMNHQEQMSELIFNITKKLEERDKAFEIRIEKINKNIETILKILIENGNKNNV